MHKRTKVGNHEPEHEAHWLQGEGHISSTDCWCEPKYYVAEDEEGTPVLIVVHAPTQNEISYLALQEIRNRERDWVTVLFNTL